VPEFRRLPKPKRGEFAENAIRKDFLPSEIEAIRRALAPAAKEEATSRKVSGRSAVDAGDTRDKIGAFAGVSGRTIEKIAAVVKAAEGMQQSRHLHKASAAKHDDPVKQQARNVQKKTGLGQLIVNDQSSHADKQLIVYQHSRAVKMALGLYLVGARSARRREVHPGPAIAR
jgi:hypothetical protein